MRYRKHGSAYSADLRDRGLPHQHRTDEQLANIARGAYVLREANGKTDAIIMATGSELGLAVRAADELQSRGINSRIVSMPNPDLFLQQDEAYRESVLPRSIKARVAVEAGVRSGWSAFVGDRGRVVGIDSFGASAPAGELFKHFGLTPENVSRAVLESLAQTE